METITEDGRLSIPLSPSWLTTGSTEAPLSLTASDGTGLRLHRLTARAHIQDPLALTELTLEFDNPEDRELEGRFEITLPPGAAVSRLAMRIGEHWQEGEVVEKQRARRIYEDFLHRAQDPALMEKAPGNRFSARVFPIPARGRKHIRIAWSQELAASDAPYTLPLQGLPALEHLSVVVTLESFEGGPPQRFTFVERDHRPEGDLVVALGVEESQVGLRSDDLLVARLRLDLDAPAEPITALTVLVDTSASQALTLPAAIRRLTDLLADLRDRGAGGIPLTVRAFDQTRRTLYDGPLSAFSVAHWPTALGASDLEAALSETRCADRLLLISDGLPTAGARDLDGLRPALSGTGARRLDVLLAGGIRDGDTPAALARGVLAADGVVLDLDAADIARRLEQATRSGITVALPGAEWSWPTTLDGVQPGDEVLVYASLPAGQPARFQVTGARPRRGIAVATVARPLLARSAAAAHIRALTAAASASPEQRAALQQRIIDLSIAHRVLCDHTALLVLETAADYDRHGLSRDALADILSLDDDGVVLLDAREPAPAPAPPRPVIREKGESLKLKKRAARREERRDDIAESAIEDIDFEDNLSTEEPESGAPDDGIGDLDADRFAAPNFQRAFDHDEPMDLEAEEDAREGAPPEPEPMGAAGGSVMESRPMPPPRSLPEPMLSAPPPAPVASAPASSLLGRIRDALRPVVEAAPEIPSHPLPLTGEFAAIHQQITDGHAQEAVADARRWHGRDPGNVLALVALGKALAAAGEEEAAARAYGSLIDLYAGRADLRRVAGELLECLPAGQPLAADTFAVAVQQRPDHPSGHRLLAWAWVRLGQWAAAFAALEAGLIAGWPEHRYPGVRQVMLEDLGLVAAGWAAADPAQADAIRARLDAAGGTWPAGPSLRLVLSWETDANDVDLHVYDRAGGHACYSSRAMPSGGRLYADVTQGYGPECFAIEGIPAAGPYRVQAHYYRRGPMGYGTGTLQIIAYDGDGGLRIESRPFVIMVDRGWVELGEVSWT